MNILVFNAGSSTLKASLFNESIFLKQKESSFSPLFETNAKVSGGSREAFKTAAAAVIDKVLQETKQDKKSISIVGHRVVHGGEKLRAATVIDEDVISEIEKRLDLAPTHNPNALGCIDAAREFFAKDAKQIAIFDTAFHRTIPLITEKNMQWARRRSISSQQTKANSMPRHPAATKHNI